MMLENRVREPFIVCLSLVLIAFLWYGEKTKNIPQYVMVFYEMGLSCDNECGEAQQLKYFQKAVRYSARLNDKIYKFSLSDAYYRLALIYKKKGNHDKALESFMRSAELNQKNILAYYEMGLYYFEKKSYEYALRCFLWVYNQPGYPDDIYYYLAKIYDHKKEYHLAIQHYLNIVSMHPEYVAEVFPRLAEIYFLLNDEDLITRRLDRFRELKKNDLADRLEQEYNALQAVGTSMGAVETE